ncbi:hypothetical protein [Acidicapsa acidisoli]|uniref:hypothetical protein n=1 Tax=Acidicapsa acidisoli TaxID=1615681 RepID=UPI0021E08613|nr:hypothetical protein [Acidicapsa acidisoli]
MKISELSNVHTMAEESALIADIHPLTAKEALAELIELLEDYAPSWYTEEHHKRALAALQGASKPSYVARVGVRSVHA